MYGSASTNDAPTVTPSQQSSSITSCVINLANTIIGAGMLGLPGAFGGTGYLTGMFLLLTAAMFSAHGLVLLSKSAQTVGLPSSFYSVAAVAVPSYTILIDLAVALKCFGVATGYLITISDSMVDALDHILLSGGSVEEADLLTKIILSRRFWVMGAVASVLPSSFYQTLGELKRASALALVFVFMLVGMIIMYANDVADPCASTPIDVCRGEIQPFTDFASTMSKGPIFVFAFTCQQNIFPIVNEMELLSQRRLDIVIASAIGIAFVLFCIVAVEGYTTFGSFVRGDILLNYPENSQVTFLRMCIALMLSLHYPLQLDPSRRCITSLVKAVVQWWGTHPMSYCNEKLSTKVFQRKQSSGIQTEMWSNTTSQTATDETSTNEDFSYNELDQTGDKTKSEPDKLFNTITVAFLSSSFILAMIVDDLGIVLALVGATGSTLVSYILPGLIYLKLHPDSSSRSMAWVQLIAGLFAIPISLYYIMTKQVSH
ncbi:hypothetical protein ACHAXN_010397 [Cyclotella atomus]